MLVATEIAVNVEVVDETYPVISVPGVAITQKNVYHAKGQGT